MSGRRTPSTVSMKGGGYYSEHTQGAKDVIDNTASLALGALADIDVATGAGPFTVADFGTKSRAWFATQFDRARNAIQREESKIDGKFWITIPAADVPGFEDMFLNVRLDLRDKHKAYDGTMLSTLRKLRCAKDASRSECVEKKE